MEWLVEKATEIGVSRISFIHCVNSERHRLKMDRLKRKAISAMKQSLKASLPQLEDMVAVGDFVDSLQHYTSGYYAHMDDPKATPLSNITDMTGSSCILIGPEGDFHEMELQMFKEAGLRPVGLGPNRLRTETAALTALILINHQSS